MTTDQELRRYLLGISDVEAQQSIEERLLGQSDELERIEALEDELIDEYVFGRLTPAEGANFEQHFLCTQERRQKLTLSRSLRRYAIDQPTDIRPATHRFEVSSFKSLFDMSTWKIASAATLLGTLLIATWLMVRDHQRQAAAVQSSKFESDRLRTELSLEKARVAALITSADNQIAHSSNPRKEMEADATLVPLALNPGVTRGIEQEARLQLPPQASLVYIVLRVAVLPKGWLRQELMNSNGDKLLIQELASSKGVTDGSTIRLVLPARLLSPDDYQIRLSEKSASGTYEEVANYTFRVSR